MQHLMWNHLNTIKITQEIPPHLTMSIDQIIKKHSITVLSEDKTVAIDTFIDQQFNYIQKLEN